MTASSSRPMIWILADLYGETILAVELGGEIQNAGTFPKLGPNLIDFVGRAVSFVEANRAPDGTIRVSIAEEGGGVQTLCNRLRELDGSTVSVLSRAAPAMEALLHVIEQAKQFGPKLILPVPPRPEPTLMPAPGEEGVADEAGHGVKIEEGQGYVPLAPMFSGTVSPGGSPMQSLGQTRIGDPPSSILRMGHGSPSPGHGAMDGGRPADVFRMGPGMDFASAKPGGAPALQEPPAAPSPVSRSTERYETFAPAAQAPGALDARIDAAVLRVARVHEGEVRAAMGKGPDELDRGSLLLWVMQSGHAQVVASADLAGERLRVAVVSHQAQIVQALGAASWEEVTEQEIALWLAEQAGAGLLGDETKAALLAYRSALRTGRRA